MVRSCLHLLAAGIISLASSSVAQEGVDPRLRDYESLLEWSFSSAPITVPADRFHWQLDTAEWHLESGQIWLQRPTSEGHITGFVFRGSDRFAKDPDLGALQETFDALVVRGVGLPPFEQ